MFNVLKKKTFGQAVKSQAREQFPGFLVSSGFGLLSLGILTVAVKVAQKVLEQKKAPLPLQQPQPPQQP